MGRARDGTAIFRGNFRRSAALPLSRCIGQVAAIAARRIEQPIALVARQVE